jgi:galactonate dehydratase
VRIASVETFVLGPRRVLVKVGTDEGVAGWGEPTLENWARTTAAAVDRLSDLLIGENPLHITRLWQILSRGGFYRGGPVIASAVAGIDQALWDIKGRWHGVPIHELLGGPCRDEVRIYAHANVSHEERTGDPALARRLVEAGYTLLKVAPRGPVLALDKVAYIDRLVADLHEFRDAIGPDIDLAVDFHGRLSRAMSRRVLPLLEPLHPIFVEEPVRPEYSAFIGELVRASTVPIATGERLYSRHEFRPVLDAGVAVVQPDLAHAGGITECFRIATLAEAYDAQVAPHCPLGPVALAACLQLDLAVPNFLAQEQGLDLHDPQAGELDLILDPAVLRPVNGAIPRLTGPGLGVDVDEASVRAAVITGPMLERAPVWRQPDGGYAEW